MNKRRYFHESLDHFYNVCRTHIYICTCELFIGTSNHTFRFHLWIHWIVVLIHICETRENAFSLIILHFVSLFSLWTRIKALNIFLTEKMSRTENETIDTGVLMTKKKFWMANIPVYHKQWLFIFQDTQLISTDTLYLTIFCFLSVKNLIF